MSLKTLVLLAALVCASQGKLSYKRLAGPPSEFEVMGVPEPLKAAETQQSAFLPLHYATSSSSDIVLSTTFAVDSESRVVVNLYAAQASCLSLRMEDASGRQVDLDSSMQDGGFQLLGGDVAPGLSFSFESPSRGIWSLEASNSCGPSLAGTDDAKVDGFLLVWNESEERMLSYLTTYSLEKDHVVGLRSEIFRHQNAPNNAHVDSLARGVLPPASSGARVTRATLDFIDPEGREHTVTMHDDGKSFGDAVANDGLFAGGYNASEAGLYQVESILQGVLADGTPFVRSTQHVLPVVDDSIHLIPVLKIARPALGSDQMPVSFKVEGGVVGSRYRVYAQVWATSTTNNKMVPACWIGGMTDLQEGGVLSLELNSKWLQLAGASEPLEFREVTVFDANMHVPLSQLASSSVGHPRGLVHDVVRATEAVTSITEEMRMGVRPARYRNVRKLSNEHDLVLVHGYCAKDNPFYKNQADFTNARYLMDLGQSRTNDEFTEVLAKFTDDLDAFSVIGHSQGGMVQLHMHNYYWTGLAGAPKNNGKLLQSVGTPYDGNSGAGTGADIIKVFGVGCGANFDLTREGAALWRAGLSPESETDVSYYFSQYKKSGLIKYCNLATNLVLKWPNDGSAEVPYRHLPGGTDDGITSAECHTTGMKWPPQCENSVRNKMMNAAAAR